MHNSRHLGNYPNGRHSWARWARSKCLHMLAASILACVTMTAVIDVLPSYGGDLPASGGPYRDRVVSAVHDGGEIVGFVPSLVNKWRHQMQHSCVLLTLMIIAYLWHALLEFLEEQGLLNKWFKDHPKLRRDLFAVGALLLLAPAIYYGSVLHDTLTRA